MTPTRADFIAVLAAYQDGQPLSLHQGSIIVAALQRAADMPEAAPAKTEASLLPAVIAKMEEGCDLLREVRDMMRRKNPQPHHIRAHDFGVPVHTSVTTFGMGQAEPGRSPPSKCQRSQLAGSASPIPDPNPKESQP